MTVDLPAGRYAVAVSGGADSVALLRLLAGGGGHDLLVVHLDHQLRGAESDADAAFVAGLAARLGLRLELARRADLPTPAMANPSARYRATRLAWFADVSRRHRLDGVVLAHHADDQAETVLLAMCRGRSPANLGGMWPVRRMPGGLVLHRPLLGVRRQALRDHLRSVGQTWREDSSNASPAYRRNVLRQWLAARPHAVPALLRLADASRRWHARLDATAPVLDATFPTAALRVPLPQAEHAARRWLVARGCPADRVPPTVCRRLVAQATAPGTSPRQHYPGGVLVRRRAGRVDVPGPARVPSAHDHGQETDRPQDL